jgi:predicted aldo/keto reductase-like oxidoreductase
MARRFDRRQFVTTGAAAVAGAAALGSRPAGASQPRETGNRVNGVPTTKLPRGGVEVPIFGVGCAYIGGYMRQGQNDKAISTLRYAYERGVRYFDSATLYPTDAVAAEALAPYMDDIYLTTRSPARPPDPAKTMRDHVELELRRYKTDVIDCFKIHNAHDYDNAMVALDELEKIREQGKIRQIGVSSHVHFETIYKLIDTERLDQVLLGRTYFPKGYYQLLSQHNMEWRERCIARAHELGMNVIGMKLMGGVLYTRSPMESAPNIDFDEGKRKKLPAAAIRWGYDDPRITLYNIGVATNQDVDDNIEIFSGDMTFTEEDRVLLAEYSTALWGTSFIRAMEEPYKYPGDGPYLDRDMQWLFDRIKEVEKELDSKRG